MFRAIGLSTGEQTVEYEGVIKGDQITGEIRLAGHGFPLVLHRGQSAPPPYRVEDVEFANGDVTLRGTLLFPNVTHKLPAIVFVHGSGDRTRNGHLYEADLLARRGIAALIFDKRGAGKSTGANWEVASLHELASDAASAVQFLAKRPEIDHERIGMYGISQGTWITAIVAAHSRDVAFVISVSGSGISVWEQDLYRTESMMRAAGYSEPDVRDAIALMKQKFEVGRTGLGWDALETRLKELRAAKVTWFPSYTGDANSLLSPRFWWLSFFSYDPAQDLTCVHVPVLTILGERDLSFPPERVAARMKQYLPPTPGNATKIIPGAEHSMLSPVTVDGRVLFQSLDPEYMKTIIAWMDSVVVNYRGQKRRLQTCCDESKGANGSEAKPTERKRRF